RVVSVLGEKTHSIMPVNNPDLPRLSVSNLSLRMHGISWVDSLELELSADRSVAIIGEADCGHSLALQFLAGIGPRSLRASGSAIHFRRRDGQVVDLLKRQGRSAAARALRGNEIGVIVGDSAVGLHPNCTVAAHFAELPMAQELSASALIEAAKTLLRRVGFPDPFAIWKRLCRDLSPAARQRLQLALAASSEPALILVDHPTRELGQVESHAWWLALHQLREQQPFALIVADDTLLAIEQRADEFMLLHRGRVVEAGGSADLLSSPLHPWLRGMVLSSPDVGLPREARLVTRRKANLPEGLGMNAVADDRRGQVLLSADTVVNDSLRRVSITVRRGETLAMVGDVGSGASTMARVLCRLEAVQSGEAQWSDRAGIGHGLPNLPAVLRRDFRRRIQYLAPGLLNPNTRARKLLSSAISAERSLSPDLLVIDELLALVDLDHADAERPLASLDRGRQRRVSLAIALASNPELLVLDRWLDDLDGNSRAELLNLLQDIREPLDVGYLLVSSEFATADYLCDRIALFCDGRLVECAAGDRLLKQPIHPYTREFLTASGCGDEALGSSSIVLPGMAITGAWPAEYRLGADESGYLCEMAAGHLVLRRSAQKTAA
ncbi:ATP-binding cassette domain-containing protein, partial [Gammaproteobacteria bacterium]|nr:ATP-binding cassette domain-containing protein [Gammaproteobacteria bacterium]